mgnify:CR=1 FL=1
MKKTIALIAHDGKKPEMVAFVKDHQELLERANIIATGTTGSYVRQTGLPVELKLSGPMGGDQQIGAMIASGEIDMMFFFWDPMEAQPHDSDVKALLRLCVLWNIPMACDRATADFVITSPFMHGDYEATIPDYSDYLNRKIVK